MIGTPLSNVFGFVVSPIGGPFGGLQFLPSAEHLLGLRQLVGIAEDVRVAPHQLCRDAVDRIGDGEVALLLGDARQEHDLEEQVAKLLAQAGLVAGVERFQRLVGFLQQEGPQAGQRLHAVPRAAVGPAQGGHDADEIVEASASSGHR